MAQPTNTASLDLCTVLDLMQHLQIKEDAGHPELPRLVAAASRYIEQWCRRKFKYDTYTNELYDGTGTSELKVRTPPVDSVSSVEVRAGLTWQTEDITYLRADDPEEVGLLYWEDNVFTEGRLNYRITYTGGMSATTLLLDPVVRQAAAELASALYRRLKQGMHLVPSVTTVDGQTMIFRDTPMPPSVSLVLRNYRVRVWD